MGRPVEMAIEFTSHQRPQRIRTLLGEGHRERGGSRGDPAAASLPSAPLRVGRWPGRGAKKALATAATLQEGAQGG